jgi:Zn-dependent M28 family amino/carboxypeptidase
MPIRIVTSFTVVIVICAHHDHLGVRNGETIAGADDNGSGTVLLLEVARIFGSHVQAGGFSAVDRRSVLFAAFGAEEEGLLGSCHMAMESPVVPLAKTRAMMNFDMVGRLGQGVVQVGGIGTGSHWGHMLANSARPELTYVDPPLCQNCSDFACFHQQAIPYIWFFTGIHDQYHTPLDDVERIDFPGLAKIGGLALRLLGRLVVMPEGPA